MRHEIDLALLAVRIALGIDARLSLPCPGGRDRRDRPHLGGFCRGGSLTRELHHHAGLAGLARLRLLTLTLRLQRLFLRR
ncbi:hypothetical protein D3C73_756670 [compost metagenome]